MEASTGEGFHRPTVPPPPLPRDTRVAALLGEPAALFFPSGTMAQQTALRVHAERTGRRTFAAHPHSHIDAWKEQGYSAVHGLRLLRAGDRNQQMTLADLAAIGEPVAAVVWELPRHDLGVLLPEWAELCEQVTAVRAAAAAAHLDGARVFEAQALYERPFDEIAGLFDTVCVSLHKSLLGVRGAVPAGKEDAMAQASVWRQRLGGEIRNAWQLALAGLAGLDRLLPRMRSSGPTRSPSRRRSTPTESPTPSPTLPGHPCSTCTCPHRRRPSRRPAKRSRPTPACGCTAQYAPRRTLARARSRSPSASTRWISRRRRSPV
ncbi:beta-eliminating lyase-related protein [Phytomonospora sp. NPDC050363]|uniref:threonine aldolase family protein n=1 Tax=Phytomonospora sp. NPDC050363 TaxID=3155642 RepID=UPI003400E10C